MQISNLLENVIIENSKNKSNKNQQENFTNMGIRSNLATKIDNYLPNTNIPPQNFPVSVILITASRYGSGVFRIQMLPLINTLIKMLYETNE